MQEQPRLLVLPLECEVASGQPARTAHPLACPRPFRIQFVLDHECRSKITCLGGSWRRLLSARPQP